MPQTEDNAWFTRFPPSDAALEACQQSVNDWKEEIGVELNLEETTWKLAARVNSWIGPKSVEAGVKDLIEPKIKGLNIPEDSLVRLSDVLARRLLAEELLGRPVTAKAVQRPE